MNKAHDEELEIAGKVIKRYVWRFIKYVTPVFLAAILTSFFLEVDYYYYLVGFLILLWHIRKMINMDEYPD